MRPALKIRASAPGLVYDMNRILDIYIFGFGFFLCFAALYFWRSKVLRSKGYRLYGIGSILLSLTIILLRFNNEFYLFLLIIGFIVVQIGAGILMTQEKYIYDSYKRLPFFKRMFSGFYPVWAAKVLAEQESDQGINSEKMNGRAAIVTGSLVICMGVGIAIWRNEIAYPVCLAATGIFFIIMGKLQKKENNVSTKS